ncbi:MAG: hypothetical protein AB7R77_17980 [Ilumatobacteraceae bacterium]
MTRSHAQTRVTLRCSLAFLVAAALAAGWGASRWLVVHLALAGGVVLAISAVSLMLAVTWSAAPAPPDRAVLAQRLLVAAGAAGVGIGRSADAPTAMVGAAGALYVTGLLTLAVLLVVTIRRGTERRFDAAVAGYVAALSAGVIGVGVGIAIATGGATAGLRSAHVTLNLLGLIGLVVAATMPYFAATVGRSKMSRWARSGVIGVVLSIMVGGLALAAGALGGGAPELAAWGFGAYVAGIGGVLVVLPRPTRRQLRWAGPRLVALWAGALWWAVAVAATGAEAADGHDVLAGRWLVVLVLGGYLQILWGSLAYVLPMLRGGGPDHLAAGFAMTRSWVGFAAANLTALAAATAAPDRVTWFAGAVWVLDTAWRLGRVGTRRTERAST